MEKVYHILIFLCLWAKVQQIFHERSLHEDGVGMRGVAGVNTDLAAPSTPWGRRGCLELHFLLEGWRKGDEGLRWRQKDLAQL